MVDNIIFRVGNVIYVDKNQFGEHGERFILENVNIENYDMMDATCVRLRLRCTHCGDFTQELQCMISKEILRIDLELSGVKANFYTVASVHHNDKSLVMTRTLYERSGICNYIRLNEYYAHPFKPQPKKETNPNILFKFQKRYGELKK